eukprot:13655408-Alexandrium_andersonii.AAC.1
MTLEVSLEARAQRISEEGCPGGNCRGPKGVSRAAHANIFLGSTNFPFGGVLGTPEVDFPLRYQLLSGEPDRRKRWLARQTGEAR